MNTYFNTGLGAIGIGNLVAGFISWQAYHDILWMIINGFFGWFYVVYYILFVRGV